MSVSRVSSMERCNYCRKVKELKPVDLTKNVQVPVCEDCYLRLKPKVF
jgi:NAD-dependent SIR2 family protein deacetylase